MSPPGPTHPTLSPLRFLSVEAVSGVVLLAAAALALAWANSPWRASYETLWHFTLPLGLDGWLPPQPLHFWVNDGLMTVFFLLVGLEIRREMHGGALRDLRVAALPLIAALGGVIVPALIYLLVSGDPAARRGWAIPTATDIAFAVGILSLVGRRVPPALRLLLLTLAIVDDIAAIAIIACYYSQGLALEGLGIAAAGVLGVLLLQRLGARAARAYLLPGAVIWLGMLRAGVHPTLTGVLLGLLTPATVAFGGARPAPAAAQLSPVERVEAMLHPWVAFGIMPIFALANAGVRLEGVTLAAAQLAVAGGVVAGLVLGKPLGIVAAAAAAVRLGLGKLPAGVHTPHLLLLGVLGGIGFTMSIFIADLAFGDPLLLTAAKLAVLVASTLAAIAGLLLGRFGPRRAHTASRGGTRAPLARS